MNNQMQHDFVIDDRGDGSIRIIWGDSGAVVVDELEDLREAREARVGLWVNQLELTEQAKGSEDGIFSMYKRIAEVGSLDGFTDEELIGIGCFLRELYIVAEELI